MRRLRGWVVSEGSPDGEIINDLPTLRTRSRDMVRNEPFGRGAINVMVQAVVGRGLKPQASPNIRALAKALNVDPTDREFLKTVDRFSEDAEDYFRTWAETKQADLRGNENFYDVSKSAYKNYLQSGDVFFTSNIRQHRGGSPYDIKIGLIEADQVANPNGVAESRRVRGGVELGPDGEAIAYWVNENQEVYPYEYKRIPRYGPHSKRELIWHLFRPERVGNSRGIPFLTPIIVVIKSKNRYSRAELDAAVNNSILAMLIKSSNPQATLSGIATGQTSESQQKQGIDFGLSSGAQIIQLDPGEDVTAFNPQRPFNAYDMFIESLARECCMALNIPYEILLRQFNSSYTAARAAYNMFERTRDVERDWFALNFTSPIWREVTTSGILHGAIEAPGFVGGSWAVRRAWLRVLWAGDTIGQIDPTKETDAAVKRIANQLSTTTAETAALTGGDYNENAQTLARERETRARYGIGPPESLANVEKILGEAVKAEGEGDKAFSEGDKAEADAGKAAAETEQTRTETDELEGGENA